jgi:hypothetical protein
MKLIGSPEPEGPPTWEEYLGLQGSLWWYDAPYGIVSRQEAFGHPNLIPVTPHGFALVALHEQGVPLQSLKRKPGGPCLTSMVEGASSIWVTVAPRYRSVCSRSR